MNVLMKREKFYTVKENVHRGVIQKVESTLTIEATVIHGMEEVDMGQGEMKKRQKLTVYSREDLLRYDAVRYKKGSRSYILGDHVNYSEMGYIDEYLSHYEYIFYKEEE